MSSLALTLPAIVLVACGDSPTESAAPCTDDIGSVAVSVGSDAQPSINWDPSCGVAMLLIEQGGSDQWFVTTDDSTWDDAAQANQIVPPVAYGAVPAGASQSGSAETLVRGVVYEAVLWRILPTGSTAACQQQNENMCLLAVHEFTH